MNSSNSAEKKHPKTRGRPKKEEVYSDKPPKLVQKRLYARKYRERIRDSVKDLEDERDFYKKLVELYYNEPKLCSSCGQRCDQPPPVYLNASPAHAQSYEAYSSPMSFQESSPRNDDQQSPSYGEQTSPRNSLQRIC
ncbi:hypothetical protein L596_000723 [Steinernema carpocapsae]|uniref:BZIP domain-containing protein n=1 Tax=Steinernema carpocapsae TaxID=34508 RepID=A0A4U8ULB4_STECR|nr:hypothetical protein L596_000723 [Steinernema carpocapsae]